MRLYRQKIGVSVEGIIVNCCYRFIDAYPCDMQRRPAASVDEDYFPSIATICVCVVRHLIICLDETSQVGSMQWGHQQ